MKQKVGELYGKPIVVGNPNEFEKYEIPLNGLGGNSFDDGMEYYKIVGTNNIDWYKNDLNYSMFVHYITSTNKCQTNCTYIKNTGCLAFATSSKIVAYQDDTLPPYLSSTTKDNLLEFLSVQNYNLNDTTIFKRITAKEYYSLLNK